MPAELSILPSYQLDKIKWNDCIQRSSNGLIYARTEYLDHMTDHWTGIILNDYSAVMPVPWKKKFGITYCPSIPFVQQLGIFSPAPGIEENNFRDALFDICSYGDYFFNYDCSGYSATARANYILKLDNGIEHLLKRFSGDAQQNIKKGISTGFRYTMAGVDEAISSFREHYSERLPDITPDHYQRFGKLCNHLSKSNHHVVRKIIDDSGNMQAIALILNDGKRLYNLMNTTTDEGRKRGINHLLLYRIWEEYQNSGLIFDFEGSDVPGVKNFYEKFNPVPEPFYQFHFNRLPKLLRWLKP